MAAHVGDPAINFRVTALLSMQRALLGMVTPDLRAVAVAIEEGRVSGSFVYDGQLTDDHREVVDEVETLLMADLPDDAFVSLEAVSSSKPDPVRAVRGTTYCYLRREP